MRGEEEEQALWRRAWNGICEEGGLGYSEVGESGWVEGGVENIEGFGGRALRGGRERLEDLEIRGGRGKGANG